MMNTPAAGTQKLGYNPMFIQKFGTKLGLETSCDVTDCVNENSSSKLPNTCTSGESLKKLESAQGNSRYMVKPELEVCEQTSENMAQVSEMISKNTDINSNYGQNLNVISVVKTCMQENSDASDLSQFESSVENSIETYSGTVEYRDEERSRETTFLPAVTDPEIDESKITIDELCHDCKYIFEDTKGEDHIMYLHAVRYKVGKNCIQCVYCVYIFFKNNHLSIKDSFIGFKLSCVCKKLLTLKIQSNNPFLNLYNDMIHVFCQPNSNLEEIHCYCDLFHHALKKYTCNSPKLPTC